MSSLSNISSELFFNESKYQILIPNIKYDQPENVTYTDIINSTESRSFAFYDEQLRVYLYARIPQQITGSGDEISSAIRLFFNQLDIHIESSIIDATANINPFNSTTTTTTTPQRTISKQMASFSSKREQPRPGGGPESLPFFSHTYNSRGKDVEPILFEHEQAYCSLFPIDIPIAYIKTRGGHPLLSINFNIAYRPLPSKLNIPKEEEINDDAEYNVDLFDTVDLLSGLSEDPVFAKSGGRPSQHFIVENRSRQPIGNEPFMHTNQSASHLLTLRSHIRETIPLRTGLAVKMRTTNASVTDKTVMMSVELENLAQAECEFLVSKVEVQVSHAVVAPAFTNEAQFPIHLETSDQMVFLYNVTLLEDGTRKPPAPPQRMFSTRRPIPTSSVPPPPSAQQQQEEQVQPQRVTIHVTGSPIINGVCAQQLRSKWNTMLDIANTRQRKDDIPDPRFNSLLTSSTPSYLSRSQTSVATSASVSPGARSVGSPTSVPGQPITHLDSALLSNIKRPIINHPNNNMNINYQQQKNGPVNQVSNGARKAPELQVADGIVISFTAPDTVHVGKVFSLHIFIVNRSKHTRRFQVMIPNRKRQPNSDVLLGTKTELPLLPMEQSVIDPFMDETEFLRQYFENETHEADIISLENNVRLPPLGPSTSQSVDIRFIAVKEKLHTIDLIQLVDEDTGFVTNLRRVLQVFVEN
ncbi:unnamed protein product [Cunninghamella echinulata]